MKYIFYLLILTMTEVVAQDETGLSDYGKSSASMGIVVVAAQEDVPQIGDRGLGLGIYFYLHWITKSSWVYSLGAGMISLNDDVLKMNRERTFLIPSVDLRIGYAVIRAYQYILSPYVGIHGFGSMTKINQEAKTVISDRSFSGGYCLGLSFTRMITYSLFLYISADYRQVLVTEQKEKMSFRVVTIGVNF